MMDGELDVLTDADIDYYDPDEEQETDNLEGDERATPGEDDPALEAEAEQELDEENPDEETDPDDPIIDLGDEKLTRSEVKQRMMFHQDYTRKTTELSHERQTVQTARQTYQQKYQQVDSLLQETVEFLKSVIPDEPPLRLSQTDPAAFQYQKELRARAMAEVQQVVAKSQQVKQSSQQVQQFEGGQAIQRHIAGLERRFPQLKGDQQKLVSFVQSKRKDALEFGFSEHEVANVTDDRILEMAHYAALGKKAKHNRDNAMRRMQPPKTGQGRAATGTSGTSNKKAMQRLAQTGSFKDALKIDFD
jgi:hypothetical protein